MSAGLDSGLAPVVTVLSPKGGSGTTTVAVNLAATLARHGGAVLVETDCANPNIEYALHLQPSHRLDDLGQRLGSDLSMLLTPHPSGIGVVCAPSDPTVSIAPDTVAQVLAHLRQMGRPLVIDTGPGWNPLTLAALQAATHLSLVTTTDVAVVRALQRALARSQAEGVELGAPHLVLNRDTRHRGLLRRDVAEALPYPIWLELAENHKLTMSANLGTPLSLTDPTGAVARGFRTLADRILFTPPRSTP